VRPFRAGLRHQVYPVAAPSAGTWTYEPLRPPAPLQLLIQNTQEHTQLIPSVTGLGHCLPSSLWSLLPPGVSCRVTHAQVCQSLGLMISPVAGLELLVPLVDIPYSCSTHMCAAQRLTTALIHGSQETESTHWLEQLDIAIQHCWYHRHTSPCDPWSCSSWWHSDLQTKINTDSSLTQGNN